MKHTHTNTKKSHAERKIEGHRDTMQYTTIYFNKTRRTARFFT